MKRKSGSIERHWTTEPAQIPHDKIDASDPGKAKNYSSRPPAGKGPTSRYFLLLFSSPFKNPSWEGATHSPLPILK